MSDPAIKFFLNDTWRMSTRKLNQLVEEGGAGGGTWASITGKPSTFPPDSHTHPSSDITGALGKYTFTIGDGSSTSITVTHSLGSVDVIVGLRLASTGANVIADWVPTTSNSVTITFGAAPATNAIKGVVIG